MRRRGFITSLVGLFVAPKVLPKSQAWETVELNVVSAPIIATTRKLRVRWSAEAAAALHQLHGVSMEDAVRGASPPVFNPGSSCDYVEC